MASNWGTHPSHTEALQCPPNQCHVNSSWALFRSGPAALSNLGTCRLLQGQGPSASKPLTVNRPPCPGFAHMGSLPAMTLKSLTPHPHAGLVYPVSRSINLPTRPSSPFAQPPLLSVPSCVLTGPQHRTDKPQSTLGLAHELGDSPHGRPHPDAQHASPSSCHPSISFSVFPFLLDGLHPTSFPKRLAQKQSKRTHKALQHPQRETSWRNPGQRPAACPHSSASWGTLFPSSPA